MTRKHICPSCHVWGNVPHRQTIPYWSLLHLKTCIATGLFCEKRFQQSQKPFVRTRLLGRDNGVLRYLIMINFWLVRHLPRTYDTETPGSVYHRQAFEMVHPKIGRYYRGNIASEHLPHGQTGCPTFSTDIAWLQNYQICAPTTPTETSYTLFRTSQIQVISTCKPMFRLPQVWAIWLDLCTIANSHW